jgi:hypothetical protein
MNLSWLSRQKPELIAGLLLVAMLLAGEVSFRVGRRLHPRSDDTGRGHFGVVQGSLLALLALLLAFNLSMATQRFEARRQLVLDHANVIGEIARQASLMPQPFQRQFQDLLRQYVGLLVMVERMIGDPSPLSLREGIATAYGLEDRMWELVRTEAHRSPPTSGVQELVQPLIRLFSIQRSRQAAYFGRVPDSVVWLLLGTATVASGTVGFSGGLGAHRGLAAKALMAGLVAATILVMLALDRPRGHLLQVSQWPMVQVQQILDRQSEVVPNKAPAR